MFVACPLACSQALGLTMHFYIRNQSTYVQTNACIYKYVFPWVLTFPVRETSPVMATFCLMGLFSARDMRADTIVIPALGPSFGTAPSGT